MRIELNLPFTDLYGRVITETVNGVHQQVTVADKLAAGLFSLSALGRTPLTAEEKYMAYSLAKRMTANPASVEITTEEASFVKRAAAELLTSGAYGQVYDIVEQKGE